MALNTIFSIILIWSPQIQLPITWCWTFGIADDNENILNKVTTELRIFSFDSSIIILICYIGLNLSDYLYTLGRFLKVPWNMLWVELFIYYSTAMIDSAESSRSQCIILLVLLIEHWINTNIIPSRFYLYTIGSA